VRSKHGERVTMLAFHDRADRVRVQRRNDIHAVILRDGATLPGNLRFDELRKQVSDSCQPR
jgi:hypothetical protein